MRDLAFDHWDIISKEVMEESDRQLSKWGYQDHDLSWWLCFLTEEVGELSEAIADDQFRDGPKKSIADEAIQVGTLALKIAEMALFPHQASLPVDEENSEPCSMCEHEDDDPYLDYCYFCGPPRWPKFSWKGGPIAEPSTEGWGWDWSKKGLQEKGSFTGHSYEPPAEPCKHENRYPSGHNLQLYCKNCGERVE